MAAQPPANDVTLFVANRGEIAVRILRTARKLSWRTVLGVSEADQDSLAARIADRTVLLGPAEARASYLDVARVVAAAKASGATAVHPGYGFLSERAEFAAAVEAAGLLWVGPPPTAIAAMGQKASAREIAVSCGVAVVPGSREATVEVARGLGFPLLVKAAAGGGGRGMRRVDHEAALPGAMLAAQAEASAAFGNAEVYLERLVDPARHVEVQLLADAFGGVCTLGTRECSVQRRHQKLVEEAPAPGLTPGAASALEQAASALARAVGYRGAGTVEFLVAPTGEAYFLEMNTRLQVEHTVTEAITGLDLVEEQLRIALGGRVPDPPVARGHAIELRVCAEDSQRGFLPSAGRLLRARWPNGPGVRVDTGFDEGDEVSAHYDSLVAKIVGFGATREAARLSLVGALQELELAGVAHTAGLGLAVLESEAFRAARVHTAWLESFEWPGPSIDAGAVAAAWLHGRAPGRSATPSTTAPVGDPWDRLGRWP